MPAVGVGLSRHGSLAPQLPSDASALGAIDTDACHPVSHGARVESSAGSMSHQTSLSSLPPASKQGLVERTKLVPSGAASRLKPVGATKTATQRTETPRADFSTGSLTVPIGRASPPKPFHVAATASQLPETPSADVSIASLSVASGRASPPKPGGATNQMETPRCDAFTGSGLVPINKPATHLRASGANQTAPQMSEASNPSRFSTGSLQWKCCVWPWERS